MKRSAYTLVELCVALAIVTVIASISAAILPGLVRSDRVVTSASQLQGWLLEARQRAQRDQVPSGLRLYGGGGTSSSPTFVSQVQLIQAPDPWTPGGQLDCQTTPSIAGMTCTAYGGLDLTGGLPQNDWPVQPGDWVRFGDGGLPMLVVANAGSSILTASAGAVCGPVSQFSFVRRARAAKGESFRYLSNGTGVDVALAQMYGAILTQGPFQNTWDILFLPSGSLAVGYGGTQGRLLLWVRQDNADSTGSGTYSGNHLIVSVKPTGAIAVDGLDQTSAGGVYSSPFTFTRDPRASGF